MENITAILHSFNRYNDQVVASMSYVRNLYVPYLFMVTNIHL